MMNHPFRQLVFVSAFCILGIGLTSCEVEDFTLGESLVSGEPFTLTKKTYAIESVKQLNIDRIQTNKMPLYQLGNYKDPVFGQTSASILSQLQLSVPNPVFGELSASAEIQNNLNEQETVTKVTLYIPYQKAAFSDRDGDGVPDIFDVDPDDPQSDSDGDGISDNDERLLGTNPLSADTDNDGVSDFDDPETIPNSFARRFDLDSIFSFSNQKSFNLKVRSSNYYLRDDDPRTDFLQAQAYFSDKQSVFESFLEKNLFEGPVVISDFQYVTYNEDDPTTTDVDESLTIDVSQSRDPGIFVELDKFFFQDRIFDLEGADALRSQSNFKDHLRGLHLSVDSSDDLMLLLDLSTAFIEIEYQYDLINTQGTTDTADDNRNQTSTTFRLNFITGSAQGFTQGNAINTWEYDRLMPVSSDETLLPKRMYLKGGSGSVVQLELPQQVIDEVKQNNWLINEASLEFYVDQEAMAPIPFEPARLYMFKATNSFPIYNSRNETSSSQTALGVYQNYDASLRRSVDGRGASYKVNITDYFNDMIVRDSLNVPINVSVSANIAFPQIQQAVLDDGTAMNYPIMSGIIPFGTVLYGPSSDVVEEKRLKLNLFYTELNEN
jgi:hypothetical protein